MSRHVKSGTEDSVDSVTDSLKSLMATSLRYTSDVTGLTFLDETMFREWGPEQILNRMLSTKSHISTTSSNTVQNEAAGDEPELRTLECIGQGQCGIIWAMTGTRWVLKITKDHKEDQLWNDFMTHKMVYECFLAQGLEFRKDINIPQTAGWVNPSHDEFWVDCNNCGPETFQPNFAFLSERIHPIPLPVREALVDAFAPPAIKKKKAAFMKMPENKSCLIRLYVGRRSKRPVNQAFRLRNFDLMVNEMEYLRLDTDMYATVMARTLAVLHWKVGIDANDVEFVLGSSPTVRSEATLAEYREAGPHKAIWKGDFLGFKRRSIGIWLIDFNECKKFTKDKAGVTQLQRAFFFNDPYYPRPENNDPKDKELWSKFKTVYLTTSSQITNSEMPGAFIEAVEVEGRRRSNTGVLFAW